MQSKKARPINKQTVRLEEAFVRKLEKYLPSLKMRKALLVESIRIKQEELVHLDNQLKNFVQSKEWGIINETCGKQLADLLFEIQPSTKISVVGGVRINVFSHIDFPRFSNVSKRMDSTYNECFELLIEVVYNVKKKMVLKNEIRDLQIACKTVTIRVNLFEKHLIPKSKKTIITIKNILSDRFMGFICQLLSVKNKKKSPIDNCILE